MANESHETKIRPLPTFSESSFFFDKQARIYFSSNLVPPITPFLSHRHLRLPQTPIATPHSNSKKKKFPRSKSKRSTLKGFTSALKENFFIF